MQEQHATKSKYTGFEIEPELISTLNKHERKKHLPTHAAKKNKEQIIMYTRIISYCMILCNAYIHTHLIMHMYVYNLSYKLYMHSYKHTSVHTALQTNHAYKYTDTNIHSNIYSYIHVHTKLHTCIRVQIIMLIHSTKKICWHTIDG